MRAAIKALPGTLWAAYKRLRAKFPVLTRQWKVARNLSAALLLLAVTPAVMGWPVLNREAAFRRLEAQALLSPTELVLQKNSAFVTEGEDWITVGMVRRFNSSWKPFQKDHPDIYHVIPKDKLTVFLVPELEDNALVAVAVGLPEEVESGVLELDAASGQAEAVRDERGWLVFRFETHSLDFMDLMGRVKEDGYALELRDAGGNTVRQVEGRFPHYLHFLSGQFAQRG